MVAIPSSTPKVWDRFQGRASMYLLFNSDIVKFLLKTNVGRHRMTNFVIFVVWNAAFVGGWVVVSWSKGFIQSRQKSRSCVPGFIKVGGRRVSPRFHRFISDINQGNEEVG